MSLEILEANRGPIEILEVGIQGPPGPAGASAITYTAGQALGGQRAVVLNGAGQAIYADHTDITHADKVLGLTTGAASQGAPVTVQSGGSLTEPSWNWTLDAEVFLSTQGQLTQTSPASGFLCAIGFPLSATSLNIRIEPAVRL